LYNDRDRGAKTTQVCYPEGVPGAVTAQLGPGDPYFIVLAANFLRSKTAWKLPKLGGYLPYGGASPAERLGSSPYGWKRRSLDNLAEPVRPGRTSLWWDTSSLIVSTRLDG
jgi:hypothetical protein